MVVLKPIKPRKRQLDELIILAQNSLKSIWSAATDIRYTTKEVEEIDEQEIKSHKLYPQYIKWVEKEFKIESQVYTLSKRALKFFEELEKIEEKMREELYANVFDNYSKKRIAYNKKLKREIEKLDWLTAQDQRELHEAEKILPNEKRFYKFTGLSAAIQRKYNLLYSSAIKLGEIIMHLRSLKNSIIEQEALLV